MAAPSGAVLYILNSKIQKVRFVHLKKIARKNGFVVEDEFSEKVTYIISELDSHEQVIRVLQKSYPEANVEKLSEKCEIVNLEWFTACMEEGTLVKVSDHHRLKIEKQKVEPVAEDPIEVDPYQNAKYSCQRVTPLVNPNQKYSDALELLEKHAEFLGGDNNLARALAFRKASAALRAHPRPIKSMSEVENLNDLKGGKHCKRVIQEILEDNFSTEVENIQSDEWFQTMQTFTGIFGCGSTTARKWYEKGHRTLDDIMQSEGGSLTLEQMKGIEHYNDLNTPVTRCEAERVLNIVRNEAEKILPGVTVIITGGFIRGKSSGHDVDFLISHPEEGKEEGLLAKLLQNLRKYLLYTDIQRKTYGEVSSSKRQNTMDRFERCFSIFKLPSESEASENGAKGEERYQDDGQEGGNPSKKMKMSSEVDSPKSDNKKTWIARRVDFVITPASQHPFALMGWTGSRMFCRSIRDYANKEMNMILTSHGLFDKTKNQFLEAKTEREIFEHLNLPYREPCERNC
ncbi:DNA-directed DNA/RNA polymerase mu [Holothuria leucospilota]|uniref:DNA-directed DNA/RNA polymerase mu n=1 Tax=Holothuria leucospilota TaxID=206669 RepID=A0A9Q1BHL1_HOLLE|nr:DNA-directed DNA/RNA polymerase mu [Holothuria leucospilota]